MKISKEDYQPALHYNINSAKALYELHKIADVLIEILTEFDNIEEEKITLTSSKAFGIKYYSISWEKEDVDQYLFKIEEVEKPTGESVEEKSHKLFGCILSFWYDQTFPMNKYGIFPDEYDMEDIDSHYMEEIYKIVKKILDINIDRKKRKEV